MVRTSWRCAAAAARGSVHLAALAFSISLCPSRAEEATDWRALCLDGDPQGQPALTLEACDRALEAGVSASEAETARFHRGLAAQMLNQQFAPSDRIEPNVEIEVFPRPRLRRD